MKIHLDPADKIFSQFIRLRDKECKRCHSLVQFNAKGMPITHEASHYFGRGKESTRYDVENVDTFCTGCHVQWGSEDREAYRDFKIKQLGENGFKALMVRANLPKKKDRKLDLMIVKEMLHHLLKTGD